MALLLLSRVRSVSGIYRGRDRRMKPIVSNNDRHQDIERTMFQEPAPAPASDRILFLTYSKDEDILKNHSDFSLPGFFPRHVQSFPALHQDRVRRIPAGKIRFPEMNGS